MYAAIEIGASRLQVSPIFNKDIFTKLEEGTRYRMQGYQYTPAYLERGWDGYIQFFNRDQTAPAGLYYRIKQILKREGKKVEIAWLNDYPPKGVLGVHGLTLADFQIQLAELATKHRVCVVSAPVRSGKTAIISAIINRIDQYPVCVVTKFRDLAKQTRKAIAHHTQRPIGIFSEGKVEIDDRGDGDKKSSDVWVTTYDALRVLNQHGIQSNKLLERNKRILEIVKKTKVLILDECQYALPKRTQTVFDLFSAIGYRIGLSGTPKRDNTTSRELEAAVGPVIKKIKYEKLIESGRIVKPQVFIYELPNSWFDSELSEHGDIYKCNIVNNINRNTFILDVVKHLWDAGLSTFIMVEWKEHGTLLQQLIPNSFFVHGNIATDVRMRMYQNVQDRQLMCLIGTVGRIGLDLPKLGAVINAGGYASSTLTIQKMRSLTACEGKKRGFVIDFIDRGRFLFKSSRERLKMYYGLDGFDIKLRRVKNNYFKERDKCKI